MSAVCSKDCFNCPFPDCINDALDAEDYRLARQIEAEITLPKSQKETQIAAYQRAYYEANKDEIAAYQRAYREAHKDEIAAKRRARRSTPEGRSAYNAYMREYQRRKRAATKAEVSE